MLRVIIVSLLVAAGARVGEVAAQSDQSGVFAPNNRYCLVQRDTAAINCMFATVQQCLEASVFGREGQCIANPGLNPAGLDVRDRR